MKRTAAGLCFAAAIALGASVAAQTQAPGTTPQPGTAPQTTSPAPQPPSASSPAAREMTLTGCIAKGADGMFTLTNVQADSSASAAGSSATPTGTAGAAGAAPSSSAGASATWNLRGSELATHVGHRVQVTGKAAAASTSGAAGATSGAAGATSGAAGATPGATTATSPDSARPQRGRLIGEQRTYARSLGGEDDRRDLPVVRSHGCRPRRHPFFRSASAQQ